MAEQTMRPPPGGAFALDEPGAQTISRNLMRMRELGTFAVALALFILLSLFAPKFFTGNNLLNVARQISILSIIAVGMTYLFISGELDLSVGSTYGMCVVLYGWLAMVANWDLILAALGVVVFGALVGMVNGLVVTKFGIPSFIVTLGMLSTMRGLALWLSGGWPVSIEKSSWFLDATGGYIRDVFPVQALWMAAVMIVGGWVLAKTRYGYHTYATGGNKQAARLNGIDTDRVKLINFMLTGACVGLAAVLLVGWLRSANPQTGAGFELDVIAAVIIGGTNLFGGAGSILGTFLGAAITGMIQNGLQLMGFNAYWAQLAQGVIIIVAVLLDLVIRRRQA
jgi:ribose transport system permease protein